MSNPVKGLYAFGDFRIDLRRGLLLRGSEPIPIPPKAFETMVVLVQSDGRLLTKEELMAKVWGETFVEENNLTQQISLLRKVLQDTEQRYIETVPRRGYRFAATLRAIDDELPDEAPPAVTEWHPIRRRWAAMAAGALLLAVVAGAVVTIPMLRSSRNDMPRSLAVLPFKPLVNGSGDAYLQLGMADTLITDLSNIGGIRVRPTSAVIQFTAPTDPAAVGRKLDVEAVLDGRIQRVGDRVRVTAQLVRVRDGSSLWAGKFDEDFRNILAVQDAISARIVSALTIDLTGDEKRRMARDATKSAEAYELYLRGRYHWYQWTPDGWAKAQEYFEQAAAKDPNFALAWAGLGDALGVQIWNHPPREFAPQAKAAHARALQIDETLAEAHNGLAALAYFYDWDHRVARAQIRRAMALKPNQALNHDVYALMLVSEGRFAEAVAESRRARDLDPTSPYMNTDLGQIYYYHHDYDQAAEQVRLALTIDPDYADALRYKASIAEQKKDYAAAIDAWARNVSLMGDPEIGAAMRAGLSSGGYHGALRQWLGGLTRKAAHSYVTPLDFADLYARLGDRDQAFLWLRKAKEEHVPGMVWVTVEPRWDSYRSDPRFQQIANKM
jgi:DNA-binding winged helix-turn-helix (wHTH) protein/TolB-like protein/Flp pilus assembly protein TadD